MKRLFGIMIMMAVSLTGCRWDGDSYDGFVTDNNRIVLCPPQLQLDDNGEAYVALEHMRCYRSRIEPDGAAFFYPTDYNLCESYRKLGFRFDGKIAFIGEFAADEKSKAVKSGICPADFPVCVYRYNEWGCKDCPSDMVKCKDLCINPMTDHDFCGADFSCAGYTVCNSNEICINGSCVVNDCADGEEKCGIDKCVNTQGNNPEHCGRCNYDCSILDNESTMSVGCSNGICLRACRQGYENCSVTSDALICIPAESMKSDRNHCGNCYTVCGSNEVCIDGHCETNTCADPGLTLCAGSDDQRECRNIHGSDENNCGACDYKCADHPSATATSNLCYEGVCLYGCKEGYTNCSGSPNIEDIICVSNRMMLSDGNNCGRCGNVCGDGYACVNGTCVNNTCTGGETLCDENGVNVCRNIKGNDADNCGACGFKCSDHPQSHAQSNKCINGLCQFECEPGYFNVGDSDVVPDCIDPLTNPKYCGQINLFTSETLRDCGNNACVNGVCQSTTCSNRAETFCQFNDNGHISTACVDLENDTNNCGYCGYKCPQNNGNMATVLKGCKNGVCEYRCDGGMAACPNMGSSELNCVDINNDANHCGGCGHKCLPGEYCFFGTCMESGCESICTPGTGCSRNGCPTVNCYNVTEYCGASCTDCVEMAHGDRGYTSCDKDTGECLIEKCQYGYHMESSINGRKTCVLNANGSCGSRTIDNHSSCGAQKSCSNDLERCVIRCAANQHPNADGTACELDSVADCGRHGHTCYSEGVRNARCDNGKCVVDLCLASYHKKTVDGDMICAKNSEFECGDHLTNCMDGIYHASKAQCTDGKCEIRECEFGYQHHYKEGGVTMCNKFLCNGQNKYAACDL